MGRTLNNLIRRWIFTFVVTCISRILLAFDRIAGHVPTGPIVAPAGLSVRRLSIPSGGNRLDAVVVRPISQPERAAVLICHGIGEVVEHWTGVQRLLASYGVASLVFDYSGYGRSSGRVDAAQCERDAISAFEHLQGIASSLPISMLGFSMGTGVAGGVLAKLDLHRLVLCAAFPTFRQAARAVGWPRALACLVPDIWRTRDSLGNCGVPILLVHGGKDQLFPPRMAAELKSRCGPQAELILVPNLSHGEPFYRPQSSYWRPVADFLLREQPADRVSTV